MLVANSPGFTISRKRQIHIHLEGCQGEVSNVGTDMSITGHQREPCGDVASRMALTARVSRRQGEEQNLAKWADLLGM